eukprot:CAMPEP_0116901428 /NCGR_PEP_ID=MMETSP0467-20121206/9341_1 /TAXON_ID=283647 /ORGANISM="Mesodinium pulex, Strain SPMC105" /LENGTH=85 /DNA_ID=CAMNT_0004574927 /DNA_START=244 /DNA_END=501 /DNA_ORIENTATION=+
MGPHSASIKQQEADRKVAEAAANYKRDMEDKAYLQKRNAQFDGSEVLNINMDENNDFIQEETHKVDIQWIPGYKNTTALKFMDEE